MKVIMRYKYILLVVQMVCSFAFAQTTTTTTTTTSNSAQRSSKQPRKQTLNFEDELIEGNVSKPDLFYLFQKKNFNYKRLIKLRENFLPEMRKTSEDIQRVRGGN